MTPPLTDRQKAVGRAFRARSVSWLAGMNEGYPVTASRCSAHVAWYRHECPGQGSQALFLRQTYILSPDGLFAFWYRHGECRRCGFSVRTEGDLDLADGTPPEKGAAVVREEELNAVGSREAAH